MIHGSVNIVFERLFGHLHSNLYLGEELCVTTTYNELQPLVTMFRLYINAWILQQKPQEQICTQDNYVYKSWCRPTVIVLSPLPLQKNTAHFFIN